MSSATIRAGIVNRREVRRALDRLGLSYTEDKGWLDSQFIVRGDMSQLLKLKKAINNANA